MLAERWTIKTVFFLSRNSCVRARGMPFLSVMSVCVCELATHGWSMHTRAAAYTNVVGIYIRTLGRSYTRYGIVCVCVCVCLLFMIHEIW